MQHGGGEKQRLRALVEGVHWAPMGTMAILARFRTMLGLAPRTRKPRRSGALLRRARLDSNQRLLPPEGSALSTELRARAGLRLYEQSRDAEWPRA